MKIDIYNLDDKIIVSGFTPWEQNVSFKKEEIVLINGRQWKIVAVERIFQGCFGTPKNRMHSLMVEPLDHDIPLQNGDELVKL